jgi:Ca2+-binding EF-hand superfamily protein
LDGAIIGFWLIEQAAKNILPADPKIMRVARLARLLRFLRVVKSIQAFDSLYLMIQAIRSSMAALFWSCVLLLLTEMMLALILNFLLEGFWSDEQIEEERRMLVYTYFGTFTRALQTMTEMLLGNWYSITRLLTENVSEWYMLFGLSHQLVIGFAVIEVITGVFLHQTFTVASMDDSIMMNEMKLAMQEQTKKINRFFEAADEDGSGTLDEGEFNEVIAKESVKDWLNAMGLPVHTFPNAFAMFDPYGTGEIDAEKMAAGASRMKGQATAFELAIVRNLVEDISRALKRDASANS